MHNVSVQDNRADIANSGVVVRSGILRGILLVADDGSDCDVWGLGGDTS